MEYDTFIFSLFDDLIYQEGREVDENDEKSVVSYTGHFKRDYTFTLHNGERQVNGGEKVVVRMKFPSNKFQILLEDETLNRISFWIERKLFSVRVVFGYVTTKTYNPFSSLVEEVPVSEESNEDDLESEEEETILIEDSSLEEQTVYQLISVYFPGEKTLTFSRKPKFELPFPHLKGVVTVAIKKDRVTFDSLITLKLERKEFEVRLVEV